MSNPKDLAKLIGPTSIVLTTSEIINLHIWAKNIPPVTYLNGTLLFVAGLSILLAHHRWTAGWPVLVTISGWFAIIGGLYRMFFPEAPQLPQNIFSYVTIAVLLVIGTFLTIKGYGREGGNT